MLMNDLYNIVPVNPPVSTVEITGEELWNMIEKNLEHTFSRDPFNQMGGYVKRCLGIRALVKVENPPMTRVQKLFIADREVKSDKVYRAVFITSQGVPPGIGHNREQRDEKMIDVMVDYLKHQEVADVGLRGTVTLI
jgi:2',3'-cyclic-nucleotide 2'-phosphodiesterase (5'-nucleotidase family)